MNPIQRRRVIFLLALRNRRRRIARKWYVRPLNRNRRRQSEYFTLVGDMRELGDNQKFFGMFRMSTDRFDDLVRRIEPHVTPSNTHVSPISASERLAATLRILEHGDSVNSVACSYRMGRSTKSKIVKETCSALYAVLQPEFLPFPSEEIFKEHSRSFWKIWNIPHFLGSFDGKHINLRCPPKSGSTFYNYKGHFSILLFACVDPQFNFSMVDIGAYGCQGDPGTFAASEFGKAILNETLPVPPPASLPGTNQISPYFFIGDEAFQLRRNFMRPYPRAQLKDDYRIYNYRYVMYLYACHHVGKGRGGRDVVRRIPERGLALFRF